MEVFVVYPDAHLYNHWSHTNNVAVRLIDFQVNHFMRATWATIDTGASTAFIVSNSGLNANGNELVRSYAVRC